MIVRHSCITAIFVVSLVVLGLVHSLAESKQNKKDKSYALSNDGDATLVVKTPNYRSAADQSQHLGLAPVGTRVEVLETRRA